MLATKINITKFITLEQKNRIFKYSSLLSQCYNLCLQSLKNNDWNKIHSITKQFQNEHTQIYSKHAQNVGRECISAVNIAKKYGVCWSAHSFNKYSLLNVKEISSNELD